MLIWQKKIRPLNNLINSILTYSPIKQPEKEKPEYSVLNPDTNSDSPSEKSKGLRFDSASIQIIQINKTGKKTKNLKLLLISL